MTMQNTTKQSLAQRWENYQPSKSMLAWACVATAVATMFIGFSWGGWVTGGTSRTMATTAGDVARGELASVICVERFKAAPDSAAKLVEFNAITDSLQETAVRRDRRLGDHAGADSLRIGVPPKAARSRSQPDFFAPSVATAAGDMLPGASPISRGARRR